MNTLYEVSDLPAKFCEKFKAIASQIRDYEKELLKIDWHSIEAKREELDQNIKDIQDNVKNIKDEIDSLEFENNDLGDFMKPIRKEYENLIDDLQQKRSNELNLKNELQYTTEKITTASKQVDQILIDLDREKTNLTDQESQLEDLDSKFASKSVWTGQLRSKWPKLAPRWPQESSNKYLAGFCRCVAPHFGPILGTYWAILGPPWLILGGLRGPLWAYLGLRRVAMGMLCGKRVGL